MAFETEILCGIHSVFEALKAKRRTFFKIYISKDRTLSRLNEILELAKDRFIQIEFAAANELDRISSRVKHQGIAAMVSPLPMKKAEVEIKNIISDRNSKDKNRENSLKQRDNIDNKNKFIVILEGVEDTHNLGAIIRTAVCAGVDHIIIQKDRAVHPSPAVSRISAGAVEHADIWSATNISSCIKLLKKHNFWVAGLDADGDTPLFSADLTDNIALVIGGEHQGIRPLVKKECDFLLSLPLLNVISSKADLSCYSKVEIKSQEGITSLNASVACGIAIYEVIRQRRFS